MRQALSPEKKFPAVLGYDLAGTVEQLGEGVTSFDLTTTYYLLPLVTSYYNSYLLQVRASLALTLLLLTT